MSAMIRRLLMLSLLAGCAVAPAPPGAFRAAGGPIWSAAAFDATRLPGTWRQPAAMARAGAPDCPAGELSITADGGVAGVLCLDGQQVPVAGRLRVVGPGRVQVSGADPGGIGAPWWVIWADESYRTLAIATPSGAFGFVLDRSPALPADRLAAAAEIFDFNGHDRRLLRRLD